jgi:hypothetical protein
MYILEVRLNTLNSGSIDVTNHLFIYLMFVTNVAIALATIVD